MIIHFAKTDIKINLFFISKNFTRILLKFAVFIVSMIIKIFKWTHIILSMNINNQEKDEYKMFIPRDLRLFQILYV